MSKYFEWEVRESGIAPLALTLTAHLIVKRGVNLSVGDPWPSVFEKWAMTRDKAAEGFEINSGGTGTCSLCCQFQTFTGGCGDCPIADYVGEEGCHGTPYFDFCGGGDPEDADRMLNFLHEVHESKMNDE